MKKTIKMMLALMAGAMAFTACSSDDILDNNEVAQSPSQLKTMTFTAVQEGQGGTRVAINGLNINWTAGDKISIFDGSNAHGGDQMFTLATGAGTAHATFTGSAADASTYYALYPYAIGSTSVTRIPTLADAQAAAGEDYDYYVEYLKEDYEGMMAIEDLKEYALPMIQDQVEEWEISEENKEIVLAYVLQQSMTIVTPGVELVGENFKNVVIPAEQTVTAGQTVDPKAMVMVAKGDNTNALQFKNVCAFVKVTPQFDCAAIALISKGTQKLAGKVDINYNSGNPTTTVTADGTNTVYLTGTIKAGNAYYIAVRPESLASGFTVEFLTANKATYYARTTDTALPLARNNVKNLGEFTTTGTWTKSLATLGNDGAGHNWMLVTPTLKLSAATAFNPFKQYSQIPAPWAGWSLPSADDFRELLDGGGIYYNQAGNLEIKGIGILKYGNTTVLTSGTPDNFWTSTPYSAGKHYVLYPASGEVSWGNDAMPCSYIFKYNN